MRKAFSLIELLIVITIIALIISLIAPNFLTLMQQFNRELMKREKSIQESIKQYYKFICGKPDCEEIKDLR